MTKAYIPLRRKTIRVGYWRWLGPPTPHFCVTQVKQVFCVTQRKSVEYRLRWVPYANFLHWPCTFHVFCVDFICVWWPMQTQFPVEYGLKTTHVLFLPTNTSTLSVSSMLCRKSTSWNGRGFRVKLMSQLIVEFPWFEEINKILTDFSMTLIFQINFPS